jgi:hypothetical protein
MIARASRPLGDDEICQCSERLLVGFERTTKAPRIIGCADRLCPPTAAHEPISRFGSVLVPVPDVIGSEQLTAMFGGGLPHVPVHAGNPLHK